MPTTCPSPEKCLRYAETVQRFGINFLRVAVFIVFAWIGGLKAFQYEADGIVPFVANSPMMSFFYDKKAPEYKQHMNKEGAVVRPISHGTRKTTPTALPTGWES